MAKRLVQQRRFHPFRSAVQAFRGNSDAELGGTIFVAFPILHNSLVYFIYYFLIKMGCLEVLLAIIFPPLAVIDKGCGSILIVTLLTIFGWVPGVVAALIILNSNK